MKYFKPELLARCRSLDDEVADSAAQEWEQAITTYRNHLRDIRQRLPAGARRLSSRVSLHDAKVLALTTRRNQPCLTLLIRLEGTASQPGNVLELAYHLVAGPHGGLIVRKHQQSKKDAPSLGWVLYDEFDLDEQHAFFTHSLLLTDGSEVEIRFHNLRVRQVEEVLVSPLELIEGERTWPLVEA